MTDTRQLLDGLVDQSDDRLDLWTNFVRRVGSREVAEIGVYRGRFAERLLNDCPGIERYYLLDPWRHLDDWNKPANKDDEKFEGFLEETLRRTAEHSDKRVVLRGKTTEVIDDIPDGSLDFAYVDGDHTLRGISIDLIRVWPKVRIGGFLAGDDFCPSIWQHRPQFEPTLVFPFAVNFAEAVGAPLYGLPYRQMLIEKVGSESFAFIDLTESYPAADIRTQMALRRAAREAKGS